MIITIGREYGSYGHKIGQLVSQKLGIAYYDKESLEAMAKKTNRYEELRDFYEEERVNSLLYVLATGSSSQKQRELPFEFIRQVATRHPCVIIGRCGNHILREFPTATHVFIHASMDYRVQLVMKRLGVSSLRARQTIESEDKIRAGFHMYYSDEKWKEVDGYHLSIDASSVTAEEAADIIIDFAKRRMRAHVGEKASGIK
jgi:cytidylate kinase